MSYGKNSDNSARLQGSGDSDSEEEVIIARPTKGRPPKNPPGENSKGKKSPEKKSYRCDRCNFSSSSKAKYTKHAKSAHSGTIVQCDHCEFKTPYKWNLDRHYKNHLGGGALCCHLCNFSCDIKQSLTVHLQNHHSNVPEEIIESVKRQQIPPRNQSINNPLLNNNNNSGNSSTPTVATTPVTSAPKTDSSSSTVAHTGTTGEAGEKKVPPLRISRSLTGLSLGEETVGGKAEGEEEEEEDKESVGAAVVAVVTVPPSVVEIAQGNDSSSSSCSGDEQQQRRHLRKCDRCDFEASGVDASSLLKKHLASLHGIHKKHHHHHHHHSHKRVRSPSLPSSPENPPKTTSPPPSPPQQAPVVPIPLPPKKSTTKGSTSPRPGQSASSCNNSPAIHRSQSPLKASEAITAYGGTGGCDQAVAPSSDEERPSHHHQSTMLNLGQSLQISGEESAFTPVLSGDYSSQALSSLKKPKHRALAQFYQKIKPKFTAEAYGETPVSIEDNKEEEEGEGQKSVGGGICSSSKSNRCQYCRQRCKSSADLAAHLEKCAEAPAAVVTKKEVEERDKKGDLDGVAESRLHTGSDDVEEVQIINGCGVAASSVADGLNDGLIGFETAPGVGAIHTGKMEEMEYQGYAGVQREEGEEARFPVEDEEAGSECRARGDGGEMEEEDEEIDEEVGVNYKGTGKGGKAAAINSRKVYRCPENDCSFWATTASRFHVHIVGHYNLKPFECSECHYKSNWRWDVNKHIRLKTPKDPKHATAKTLLTHESGQRDYRKYDNYLVSMSLTHGANAKTPDCSTMASKRTKGGNNTVASPKSSPEAVHSPSGKESGSSPVNSPASSTTTKRSPKYTKALAASSSPTQEEIQTAFEYHPSQDHPPMSTSRHQQQSDETATYNPTMELGNLSAASPASVSSEGRTFVEARVMAGGEICYQQQQNSLLKHQQREDLGMVSPTTVSDGGTDGPPNGFDLTVKRPHSRYAHHSAAEESLRANEDMTVTTMLLPDAPVAQTTAHMLSSNSYLQPTPPPTKKSRLKQLQQQQEQLEQQQHEHAISGALQEEGGKAEGGVQWQCIKCSFKHPNKELVSCHIRDTHKPKKGDPLSLLAHNHLIQVLTPGQQEGQDSLNMSSGISQREEQELGRERGTLSPAQKKEMIQQMFHENGKVLSCKYCPFSTGLLYEMEIHADHHLNKSQSYFSCPHCSYSVAVKSELQEHLRLHVGDLLPEIQNRLINSSTTILSSSIMPSPTSTTENLNKSNETSKHFKYHCVECPYSGNDHSEFQYHKQCHEPHEYPFKCHRCTFNVSVKFHLLQHLRVHGIQIDEVGVPSSGDQYSAANVPVPEPMYEDVSNDYSPPAIQDEPLNLSIFANRKPVVIWENGVPMEGYRCGVCLQVFHDLNDLREHEYTTNHRSVIGAGSSQNTSAGGTSGNNAYDTSRQCESPPAEAMNLCFKPTASTTAVDSHHHSGSTVSAFKKSSHSKVKDSAKRSASSSHSTQSLQQQQQQQQLQPLQLQQHQTTSIPVSSPSPGSSVHSAELGGAIGKGEKEYLYLCDECPARFFFEKELKIHHTFHENKSSFGCPKCTYSARQKDPHLMSHMRVHGTAYQEKTKALLVKFPRGKVNFSSTTNSSGNSSSAASNNAAANAAAAAAAAALSSAASLINSSLLTSNFNFTAAAMLSAGGKFKPGDVSAAAFGYPGDHSHAALEGLRKNGLSIVCPKCPEKFYSTQTFQQHYEMHNPNGRADYRCRFCDYCADSRKSLTLHEIVHSAGGGSTADLEAAALAGKLLASPGTAFNPVSMMAMVAHQDSPFTAAAVSKQSVKSSSSNGANGDSGTSEGVDKNQIPVPDEAYEGNPEFVYPTYMKNGRVKSKRYKCIKCPSAFEKKDQYHTHIGLHGSKQKYKCTVCDYAVTYYANYIQHLKKHENQRNIPSELLALGRKRHQDDLEANGNGTSSSVPTKIVKLAENGENSSSSNGSLDSVENHHHQSLHPNSLTNGLPHRSSPLIRCSLCPFQCFEESSLENHLVHHQDNPNWLHVCNICSFRTSSKKSLKEHARLHLLNSYQLQQQQQAHHLQNGNGVTSNGHGHHVARNGEFISNGYHLDNRHQQQPRNRQYIGEQINHHHHHHEDSSNGSC